MTTQTDTPKRPRQFSLAERNEHFPLEYEVHLGRNGKPEITVPLKWEALNCARIAIPGTSWNPRVHKLAAPVFEDWFKRAHESGAITSIESYDGGYVPRLKRGVELPHAGAPKSAYDKLLSNHSRGTAIDINAKWNPMGIPYDHKKWKGEGDLSLLIAVANDVHVRQSDGTAWGIVCGAHWKGASIDPMHFEIGVW